MANWVSVQGNSIVSDFTNDVQLEYHPGGVLIKPRAGANFPYRGVFHANLPSAPNGSTTVKRMEIKHHDHFVKPKKFEIFHGAKPVCFGDDSTYPNIFEVDVEGGSPEHLGWTVSVAVEFLSAKAQLTVESVTLEFKP